MLCSQSMGILQLGETKTLWTEKCVRKLKWYVHDVLGTWDSPLECWSVASTITQKWKPAKQTYPSYLHETNDGKASLLVCVMLRVDKIRPASAESLAGWASTKR
jgi:hypothetical protein